ncbi:MAG: peptide-binding protein [Candidatus Omnitrophica bacterium]|nr:peptide-binding protein [Candidatus Omnitrophota bacterium]MDD5488126.1 peptide-binding protein [Candidatus Omnitrophota bacterium]
MLPFFYADAATASRTPRDAYVSAGTGDARILIPFLADDVASSSICGMVYNGLTKVDKDLTVVPDLAESWVVSADGLSITFKLRDGVKWHDGRPFSANDVKFTFETILDPATGCPYTGAYKDIKSIKVEDSRTITFEYAAPYAPALLKLGMGIIPEHIFSEVGDMRSSPHARDPIGTGPYKFIRWRTGEYILLEANTEYFGGCPGIKRYVYRIIPDESVQFLELITESIDSMDLNPYQYVYRSGGDSFKRRINKYKYLAHAYTYVGYNLRDPLFSDRNVRIALSLAINRGNIIDSVLLGQGERCDGPFIKGTAYYDDNVEEYVYDPDKAKRLLMNAGWADVDNDGVLEKDGMEFHVRLITNQGNQVREDVATMIQSDWAAIGIKTDIQVVAWAAFLDQFVKGGKFQAVLLGWTLPADPDPYAVWHSSSAGENGLNLISYSDPEVDRLIEEGRREFDPARRGEIYRAIHSRIHDAAPYTFLFYPYAEPAINSRFNGIRPEPAGISYNFVEWYVDDNKVKYAF